MKHTTRIFRLITALAFIASTSLQAVRPALAQEGGGERIAHNANTGKVSFIGAPAGTSISIPAARSPGMAPRDRALAMLRPYAAAFGLTSADEELRVRSEPVGADPGVTHFQQVYRGVPVMAGEVVVNATDQSTLLSINGEIAPDLEMDVTPRVAPELAQQAAQQAMTRIHGGAAADYVTSEPELWIYDSRLLQPDGTEPGLVWRMNVGARDTGLPVNELVLIDAQRGNVRLNFNQIDTSWRSGVRSGPAPALSRASQSEAVDSVRAGRGPQAPLGTGFGDRYVSTAGTDASNCTNSASPCLTINYAIGQARADETIYVAVGTYTGTGGSVVEITKNIILSGGWDGAFAAQAGRSTVDGEGTRSGISLSLDQTATVNRFEILHATDGIFSNGTLEVADSLIHDNAGTYASGIDSRGPLTISNSAIFSNHNAGGRGGGVYVTTGPASIWNSTISLNHADRGGGLFVSSGTAQLNNVTITGNSSGTGGGIYNDGGTVAVQNSILAYNTATGYYPPLPGNYQDCYGTITSPNGGHNVIWYRPGCNGYAATGNLYVDPLMSSFVTTLGVHPIQATSPAIDSANPATCIASGDQRGRPRIGVCDRGAVEYAPAGIATQMVPAGGDAQHAPPGGTLSEPFDVQVLDGFSSPVPGVAVTFTAPASGPSGTFAPAATETSVATSDAGGIATATAFTVNTELGSFAVVATADGVSTPVEFAVEIMQWYVATTGSDANSCSDPGLPCATIQAAVNKAASGDRILVAEGAYTGAGTQVVQIQHSADLSGGWDDDFENQNGYSVIDGQNARPGVSVGGAGSSSMDRFIIQNGHTGNDGGGLRVSGGTLSLSRSVVRDNDAYAGGGISVSDAALHLENVTVRGNIADWHSGGGIYAYLGILELNNVTMVDNTTTAEGGGLSYYGTSISVQNSIIANNNATSYPESPDCYRDSASPGNFYLLDHSLLESAPHCYAPSGNGNITGADPELTYAMGRGYYIPAPMSPALDSANDGTCLADDQRGLPRPQGDGCDMGGYEAGAGSGPPTTIQAFRGDGQRSIAPNLFITSLAVYVRDAEGNPVNGATVTFTAPQSGPSGTFGDTHSYESTANTAANGVATVAVFGPNAMLGEYEVTASVVPLSATFSLENGAFFVSTAGDDLNSCNAPLEPCATINGALGKSSADDHVLVAAGTYTDAGAVAVADVIQSTYISGGWDPEFATQSERTILDGQDTRPGVQLNLGITAAVRNLEIRRGLGTEGGGIHSRADLTLEDVTIRQSRAQNIGGGIWHGDGQLMAENITISGNIAAFDGGGIIVTSGSAEINNSTISQNLVTSSSGATYGGGVSNPGGYPVLVRNTILAGNTAEWSPDCRGEITSGGHNLIGFGAGCALSAAPGDLVGAPSSALDARLGDLADNGGPGLTHALLTGSPAIDAGDPATCAAEDERGITRPVGAACDIGAFEGSEAQGTGPTVRTYTTNHSTVVPGTFLCDQMQPACTNGSNTDADFAHQFALGSDALYRTRFGRNGIAGNNMPIVSTVQYDNQYDNAFWSGAQMVFGDAHGFAQADDVVAHELTHGVTQYESNLFYYYQSGAISESLSDVFGELFDQSNGAGDDGPSAKWLIGEDVSGASASRSMSDPPAYGGMPSTIDPLNPTSGDPDRMTDPNYYVGEYDNGGVHENSGVNNKAAYLMADGGTLIPEP